MSVDSCVEKIDVFLAALSLPKVGTSDPEAFAVLYMKDHKAPHELVQIGMTPAIRNQANPSWSTPITVDFMFEVRQEVVIKVYHNHQGVSILDLSLHTLLGEATFTLASLLTSQTKKLCPTLGGPNCMQGSLVIHAEARSNTQDFFCVNFKGTKLANKDGFFGASDPFLVISRISEDGMYTVVWKSNKIDDTLNPVWPAAKIPLTTLCNGDLLRPLRIAVWDWEASGKHQTMGQVDVTVQRLLDACGASFDVIEPEKKGKWGYSNSGQLSAENARIETIDGTLVTPSTTPLCSPSAQGAVPGSPTAVSAATPTPTSAVPAAVPRMMSTKHPYSFADYILHGCEISLITAIDFTASNCDPGFPGSLHYMGDPSKPNTYQKTIRAVGDILGPYDHDQQYPVYGFGAQVKKPDGNFSEVLHCIPLHTWGMEVQGVEGILQAYKDSVSVLNFSGPTNFAPLIQTATASAIGRNCTQEKQTYTILLIITDGSVHDMEETKAAIVAASTQPISIIIVGVGYEDFTSMVELDSDHMMMSAGGKTAARDIVQFIHHKEQDYDVLTEGLLAEVPDQFLKFMEMRGIRPNKA